jgi:RNA recognition motif-containing protein
VESPRVYVGNLSYDVTEGDLQDLFKGIGGVRNIEIVYNRATHRSKGYGFVEMLHVDEAKRAVEILHDQPFMGRQMTVSGAKSKGQDEREDAEEREERQERRPRPAPVVAAAAATAVVTAESLEATAQIDTIMETPPAAPEPTDSIAEAATEPVPAAAVIEPSADRA